ncbi:MAG: zinc metallopeptidase [Victivallaceae bacterium]|nr:zinc metallopeptidase [Victivallaceae bacterium]NLK84182.1 zinc metallopeptidase [Lentisphaerota bacterium]
MFFDPMYLLFALPGLLFALYASFTTKTTFAKYSKVMSSTGVSGAEAAARLLRDAGIHDVGIEMADGFLSDHYDPSAKMLRLSSAVYNGRSLSSIGVACHEAGHAIQHAENYAPLGMRSALVPLAGISSPLSYVFILIGFLFNSPNFILFGALVFSAAVLFSIVTLPVEYNASARAKRLMVSAGIVSSREAEDAGAVLNAAFMTYVAAAVSAILTLLYYLWRSGIFGGRSND